MPPTESLLLDPDFVRDPHADLERLRAEDPVYRDPHLGWWFITRYEDVKQFLSDPIPNTVVARIAGIPPLKLHRRLCTTGSCG